MSSKRKGLLALVVLLGIAAAIGAALILGPGARGPGGGRGAGPSLSPSDRALLATLAPAEQKTVIQAYSAALAGGKKARLADYMPESAYSVKVAVASRSTLRAYIDVTGDVQAATSVEACPDIGGRIASISVELGDSVEKGQVIAQVDPSLPGSMYALSPVRAPISGVVTDIAEGVGAKVTASTAVATVGILSMLEVKTLIRERDVGDVRVGQRAVLRFEAFPGRSFEARLSRLSPVLDKASRTRAATIAIEGDRGRVAPGMYARARIYTATYADVVAVPEDAVFERFGEQCAYVVERKEDADRARLAKLETGARIDGLVEVRSGLAEGDRVVGAGRAALGDGSLVRVISGGKAAK